MGFFSRGKVVTIGTTNSLEEGIWNEGSVPGGWLKQRSCLLRGIYRKRCLCGTFLDTVGAGHSAYPESVSGANLCLLNLLKLMNYTKYFCNTVCLRGI